MEAPKKIVLISDLSLRCLVRMWLRNLWVIAAGAAICAMAASLYVSWLHVPQYRASMTYAVVIRQDSLAISENASASKEVTAVMTELLKTDIIAQKLRQADGRLEGTSAAIRAKQVGETNLIDVTAESPSAERSYLTLVALEQVFPELSDYLSATSVAQVIRKPTVSLTPINAVDAGALMVRFALLGALLQALVLAAFSLMRGTVQSQEGAKRLVDAKILSTVGHERKNRTLKAMLTRSTRGLQVFAPTTSAAYTEQINRICSRLEQEHGERGYQCFLVAGVGENEGKSTVAGNTASALAMKGRRVVLVDGDLRKPAMVKFFDGVYDCDVPFEQLLAAPYELERLEKCLYRDKRLGLSMLFAGGPEEKSMQLLTGETMLRCLEVLRQRFDYIIIDTPPMGFFPDAEALAELADASLLVVRQDYTPACDINDAIDTLRRGKSRFLGCVLNDMDLSSMGGYGYGYGYGAKNRGYGTAKRD